MLPWVHSNKVTSQIHLWRLDPGPSWWISGMLKSTGLCSTNAFDQRRFCITRSSIDQRSTLVCVVPFPISSKCIQSKSNYLEQFIVILEEDWPGKGINTEWNIKYTDTEIPQNSSKGYLLLLLESLSFLRPQFTDTCTQRKMYKQKWKHVVCGPPLLVGQHKFEKKSGGQISGGERLLSSFSSSYSLFLVSDPWRAFWAVTATLQKPSTLKRRSLGTKEIPA